MITVHCSANSNGSLTTGEDIRRYHMDTPPKGRGWSDIGYHAVIEFDGGLFRGRPDDHQGAHVEGANDGNLGVCLIGNTEFSRAQFTTLKWAIDHWKAAYQITDDKVFCHYQWPSAVKQGKTCPNIKQFDLLAFLRDGDFAFVRKYLALT
jgi:N-acetylmuramoyl-L-alanine amidase